MTQKRQKTIFLLKAQDDYIIFMKGKQGDFEIGQLRLMMDGDYDFVPRPDIHSYFHEVLADIADVCTKINMPWHEDITEYLKDEHRTA